jgi:hypothetical protein
MGEFYSRQLLSAVTPLTGGWPHPSGASGADYQTTSADSAGPNRILIFQLIFGSSPRSLALDISFASALSYSWGFGNRVIKLTHELRVSSATIRFIAKF